MIRHWIEAARPKTLPAAVVPVMVGTAEAYRNGYVAWWPVAACLGFSLLAQIATNMANDAYDYIRGADTSERVGPERMVSAGKVSARSMLVASFVVFGIAFLVGLSLVAYRGWELLAVGVISIVFGYGYTGGPFPLAYKGLGDLFVVLFFGLVATGGTFYVLTGWLSLEVGLLGLALGLLANNILVVNNYRDRATDRKAGKMTLIARFGKRFGCIQYWVQMIVAFGAVALYAAEIGRWTALLPLLLLPAGAALAVALPRWQGERLNGLLARSAALVLAAGLLLALGICLA